MDNKLNLTYVFFTIGFLNFVFLLDTIFTDPMDDFNFFSIKSSKTMNLFYYFMVFIILIGAGINNYRKTYGKSKKIR